MRIRGRFSALIALVAVILVGFSGAPANAHSDLESSIPASGSRVSSLSVFTLTFVEAVVPEFSKYTLVDSMGMSVALGTPSYDVTKTIVSVPVTGELMATTYDIGYAVLSTDGHPISGKVNFTSTAVGPAPTPSPTKTESASPAPSPDDGSNMLANIGYAVAGLLGGAIIVAVLTIRVRRRSKP